MDFRGCWWLLICCDLSLHKSNWIVEGSCGFVHEGSAHLLTCFILLVGENTSLSESWTPFTCMYFIKFDYWTFSFESYGYCCYCCCCSESYILLSGAACGQSNHFTCISDYVPPSIFSPRLFHLLHLFLSLLLSCCSSSCTSPQLVQQQQPPVLPLLAVQQPDSCFDAASVFFFSLSFLAPPSSCFFHAKPFLQAVWAHSEGLVKKFD